MGVYHDLSGGTSVVPPLQSSTLFIANGTNDPFRRQIAKADVREPCAEPREESETTPRAGALNVRQTNDGVAGERDDSRGGRDHGIVVEIRCKGQRVGSAIRMIEGASLGSARMLCAT